jgi:hypothetical protein
VKKSKVRALVADVLAQGRLVREPVTFRQLEVDFEAHTVTLEGRVIHVDARAFVIPILSGDAVFMWNADMERIG